MIVFMQGSIAPGTLSTNVSMLFLSGKRMSMDYNSIASNVDRMPRQVPAFTRRCVRSHMKSVLQRNRS